MECKDGFYGEQCKENCSSGCKTATCLKSNGSCECKPRHNQIEGTQCLPCPENCLNSCNQSFYCDSCNNGYYNDDCNRTCSTNCKDDKCDRDGSCTCKPGAPFVECCPENCQGRCEDLTVCNACKPGYYGRYCIETCPSNCEGRCSRTQGECEVCKKRYWGSRCSYNCSDHCLNNVCGKLNGACSCKVGYRGENCTLGEKQSSVYFVFDHHWPIYLYYQYLYINIYIYNTECDDQSWGPSCNQTCRCASGSCHHVNGSCDSGCMRGWTGEACQEPYGQSLIL